MPRAVSLFLPRFPTDRIRKRPDAPPPDRPLVTAEKVGARRLIAAVDPAAAALGLRPGLTITHAQAVVPDLQVAEADPAGDGAALERLAEWAFRYAPLVALDPPDGLLLDIAGCEHLFGGEAGLLADLLRRLGAAGFCARAAAAGTFGAAAALARFGKPEPILIPPGQEHDALRNLPIEALRLGEDLAASLRRLGLERIGQLLGLPRAPLARRFGMALGARLDAVLGRRADPVVWREPAKMLMRRRAFAEPIAAPDSLVRVTQDLAAALCRDLEKAGLGARRLDLVFRRVDGAVQAIRIGTAKASRDPDHLAPLLLGRIETVDPGFGIDEAVLRLARGERLAPRQLAGAAAEEEEPDIGLLVDRLAARLGEARLYRLAPVESDVPERSVRRLAPLGPHPAGTWPKRLPRPVRLLARPEPIETVASLPDAPPALFVWRRVRHRVRRADGPERIHGEWWRAEGEADALRDYYQVEDEAGARFWLFRTGRSNGEAGWFLHGLFG